MNRLCTKASFKTPKSCADPERFVRGGPTLTSCLVDEGREDPNTTLSGPSSARQQIDIKWRIAGGPTLNAGLDAL